MLRVDVHKTLGTMQLDVTFESAGGVTALFGHSGAGKTSVINIIAGLLRPDRGRIELDGECLDDTAARIHVPVHRRRIGYMFQDARLFPHLSVAQNLDYGRRRTGLSYDEGEQDRVVRMLNLEALRSRWRLVACQVVHCGDCPANQAIGQQKLAHAAFAQQFGQRI